MNIGVHPNLVSSHLSDYICQDPPSKLDDIYRYLGLGLQYIFLGDTTQITIVMLTESEMSFFWVISVNRARLKSISLSIYTHM